MHREMEELHRGLIFALYKVSSDISAHLITLQCCLRVKYYSLVVLGLSRNVYKGSDY